MTDVHSKPSHDRDSVLSDHAVRTIGTEFTLGSFPKCPIYPPCFCLMAAQMVSSAVLFLFSFLDLFRCGDGHALFSRFGLTKYALPSEHTLIFQPFHFPVVV